MGLERGSGGPAANPRAGAHQCRAEYKSILNAKSRDKQRGLAQSLPSNLSPPEHIRAAANLAKGDRTFLDAETAECVRCAAQATLPEAQAFRKERLAALKAEFGTAQGGIRADVIETLMRKHGLEPRPLTERLATSFPMTGKLGYPDIYPSDPALAAEDAQPELSTEELLREQPMVLERALAAIKSTSPEDKLFLWESMKTETENGFATEISVDALRLEKAVFFQRFAVDQLKNEKPGWVFKKRPCDNGRSAQINRATLVYTPIKLATADVYAEALAEFTQQAQVDTVEQVHLAAPRSLTVLAGQSLQW